MIPGLPRVDAIAPSDLGACARGAHDGRWWCWAIFTGQLLGASDPTMVTVEAPRRAPVLDGSVAVTVYATPCAVQADGTVACWGGPAGGDPHVGGLHDVVGVVSDEDAVCAWTASGAVDCWGGGGAGPTDLGTELFGPPQPTPRTIWQED